MEVAPLIQSIMEELQSGQSTITHLAGCDQIDKIAFDAGLAYEDFLKA